MQVFFFSKFLVGLPSLLFCVSFIEQTKQNKTKENNNNNKKKRTDKQTIGTYRWIEGFLKCFSFVGLAALTQTYELVIKKT